MSVGGKVTSKALGSGDEALDLLGAFGKFKPENADELAKVQSLLKKGTSDAPGLRGAFGTFKPENAAELQRVRELRAVGLHQVMADPKAFDLTSDLAALNQATRNGSRSLSSSQLKSFASPTEKALQLVDAAETSRRMGLGMSGFDAGALEQASSFLRQVGFGHRADDAAALVRLGFGG